MDKNYDNIIQTDMEEKYGRQAICMKKADGNMDAFVVVAGKEFTIDDIIQRLIEGEKNMSPYESGFALIGEWRAKLLYEYWDTMENESEPGGWEYPGIYVPGTRKIPRFSKDAYLPSYILGRWYGDAREIPVPILGKKPVFGMIHTGYSADLNVLELAKKEIDVYLRHGIYPLIENYFGSADDCESVLSWLQNAHPDAVYGVNILGDYPRAFELARKYDAKFIQIDSVCGHLVPEKDEQYAENLQHYREQNPNVLVFGGVRFKYQPVESGRSLADDLRLGMERCDAIVCTGEGTGQSTPYDKTEQFKYFLKDFPVIVGAGVTVETARHTAEISDGAIVGSWFKEGHKDIGAVNEEYVEEFMRRWNKGANGPLQEGEDMYDELMTNTYYHGKGYSWDKTDNEGMQTLNTLVGGYWKPRYLLDHNRKVAFEIMDEWLLWKHFSIEDIDWDSLKGLDDEAISKARRLSASYPSFIKNYEDGVAVVKWQLIPDGRYWMDEDGFGMTSDVETNVYAVVDKSLNVLVKFRHIGNDYAQLHQMRAEALQKLPQH